MTNRMTRHEHFETLERLKRWTSLLDRFPRGVRIYSREHRAYWRGTGQGYTSDIRHSAVWELGKAFERTKHCGPEKRIEFEEA